MMDEIGSSRLETLSRPESGGAPPPRAAGPAGRAKGKIVVEARSFNGAASYRIGIGNTSSANSSSRAGPSSSST